MESFSPAKVSQVLQQFRLGMVDDVDRGGACRFSKRDDAHAELKAAQEKGDQEAIEKFSKRTVKVTREHVEDCKKLLTLMGVPYVEVCCSQQRLTTLLHYLSVLFDIAIF